MKMNSIDSLTNVMKMIVQHDTAALEPYKPKVCFTCGCDPVQVYNEMINGMRIQELGSVPINRMREYQRYV